MISQARTEIVESAVGMSGTASWRVDTLVTEDDLLALEPEWRRLEPRMNPLPFVCFDWIVPWWQHFRSQGGVVRDDLFICAFRTAAGELIGVAPLMLTQRPSVGPLRYRQLQFFGADRNITEVRCMATAPENMEALYSALLDHLRQFQRRWNATSLTGLPSGCAALEARINGTYVSRFWDADTANPILDLKPSWEEFKCGLPRNIKESLRKCYNAPSRDGLSLEFRVLSEAADVNTAVHRFFELHRARSEMPSLVNHADTFASYRSQEFFLDVSRRFAERGALRIFELRHNDSVIAIRIGFVRQDTLYLYYSGFDPAYRRYSVMTRLVAEAIKYAIVNGFRTLNLSTGRDFSKTRWAPRETVYRNVEFSSPARIDSLKHRGFRTFFNYVQHRSPHGWVSRALSRGH
jgi:CelD/BcsL family acetyltransferase involved in cellulose biosynthesis